MVLLSPARVLPCLFLRCLFAPSHFSPSCDKDLPKRPNPSIWPGCTKRNNIFVAFSGELLLSGLGYEWDRHKTGSRVLPYIILSDMLYWYYDYYHGGFVQSKVLPRRKRATCQNPWHLSQSGPSKPQLDQAHHFPYLVVVQQLWIKGLIRDVYNFDDRD